VAIVTIDWEPYYCYRPHSEFWEKNDPLVDEPTEYLLDFLRRHDLKAIFYCLGFLKDKKPDLFQKIKDDGHTIGDHTYYHKLERERPEGLFRAPRWEGEKRLFSGGFWFRFMPYWWVKREVEKTGILFIHPYDVMLSHPNTGNPIHNFTRQVGLENSRNRMERIVREITFEDPKEYFL